ncbi:hypothetical protein DFH06DRAFT_1191321 [Mycena polygramma]|nr:hypothetical protein DFH06DRAFT_1191321 [Mycena polygramma]
MHFAPSLYVFLPLLSPICFTQFLVPAANEINTSHTTSDSDSDSDPPIFVPPFVRPGHHVNLFCSVGTRYACPSPSYPHAR